MRLRLVQTRSGVSAQFDVVSGGVLVGRAVQSNNVTFGGSWETEYAGRAIRMDYRRAEMLGNISKSAENRQYMPYLIRNDAGQELGKIVRKYSDGSIFRRYEYVEMIFAGCVYSMYVIGLGREGYAFPVYCGETQVALIEKGCEVRNNLDEYEVTCRGGFDLQSILLGLYLDGMLFANRGEIATQSVKKSFLITTNKQLKAKHDPLFKNTVQ